MDQGQSLSILAVDDEPGVLVLVRRCLAEPRFVMNVAADGEKALEIMGKGPALDLLIADLRMPGMQGDELARQARLRQPELKVLYLTGHAGRLFKTTAPLEPRDAYLDKPFTRAGLREAVALLLFGCTTLHVAPVVSQDGSRPVTTP
jgi:CheY-like chemotaxis protein